VKELRKQPWGAGSIQRLFGEEGVEEDMVLAQIGFVPGVAFKLCSSGPTPATVLVLDLGSEWWKKLAGFMYLLSCTCRPTRPWLTLCY